MGDSEWVAAGPNLGTKAAADEAANAELKAAQDEAVESRVAKAPDRPQTNVEKVTELARHISSQSREFGLCGTTLRLVPEKDALAGELSGFESAVKQFVNVKVELVKDADGKSDIVHIFGVKVDNGG